MTSLGIFEAGCPERDLILAALTLGVSECVYREPDSDKSAGSEVGMPSARADFHRMGPIRVWLRLFGPGGDLVAGTLEMAGISRTRPDYFSDVRGDYSDAGVTRATLASIDPRAGACKRSASHERIQPQALQNICALLLRVWN